jgi:hypothetical protein
MWRRQPETLRIVMEPSQSGLSLTHIVATLRADVQRSVVHAAMWRKTRHPCTVREYNYCGLQSKRTVLAYTNERKEEEFLVKLHGKLRPERCA